MRILYVQQHFATDRGEGGVRGYNLVRALVERHHLVTVICGCNWRDRTLRSSSGRWVDEKMLDGFRLVQLNVFYSNKQSFNARVRSFLAFALLACREVTRRPADLVFASSTPLTVSLPAMWGGVVRRLPYVLEVRDLWPDLPVEMGIIKNPLLKALLYGWERTAYRRATRLVALAPGIKAGIQQKAGVDPGLIAMIPNGSDTRALRPLSPPERSHLPVPRSTLLFGYCGTHGIANGLDAVLDAAGVLQRRGVTDVAFALVGDGREKARLKERAVREKLANVSFFDLHDKRTYNEVLADLDVGMQILMDVPGFQWGTSPNKFFDYLAAGRPVLVNYPGWMAKLVTDAGCGVAVPPGDPEAFADAVVRFRDSRELLSPMGRASRELAEREFAHDRILPELCRFLEEMGPQRSPEAPQLPVSAVSGSS